MPGGLGGETATGAGGCGLFIGVVEAVTIALGCGFPASDAWEQAVSPITKKLRTDSDRCLVTEPCNSVVEIICLNGV